MINKLKTKVHQLYVKLVIRYQQLTQHHYYQKVSKLLNQYGVSLVALISFSLALGLFFWPQYFGFLIILLAKLKIIFLTLLWACLGMLAGGVISSLIESKGQVLTDNTTQFLDYCSKSNGMVFFGKVGSGKTAILAMLAHYLPTENKYASFPCSLPWLKRYHISFDSAPAKPLGITEDIFIDETNLLFKGNIVSDVREQQRFLMHFMALSRQQGVRVFANGQRLGQFSIEQREITTAVCEVELLHKTDEGIYVSCEIWQSSGWTNSKTEEKFVIFVAKKYLETYNSYWLKSLKYLRSQQSYI